MREILYHNLWLIIVSFLCDTYSSPIVNSGNTSSLPRVLLISFDGFRAQYFKNHNLPNFQQFFNEGVFTNVKSAFPSLTFPNHYSLVTGLNKSLMLVEHHGITANVIYDKFMDRLFTPSCCDDDNRWWQQNANVLPIWQANQHASSNRRSGASGFVGSLSPVCGMNLFRALPYSNSRPFKEIVDTMIEWFTDPDKPVNFMSIYFYEPDKTGHSKGPNSPEISNILIECDRLMAYIRQEMQAKGIWNDTDIIVTTDHGMEDVSPSRSAVLEHYIDLSQCNVTNSLVIVSIFTANVQTTLEVYKNLSNVIPNCKVYLRETVPEEYHYSDNIRVGDVVIVADPGYMVYQTEREQSTSTIKGTHGYNSSIPEMMGFMSARGPSIATRQDDEPVTINLVDIYPLMEELLQLPHRKVDGSIEKVKWLLKNPPV